MTEANWSFTWLGYPGALGEPAWLIGAGVAAAVALWAIWVALGRRQRLGERISPRFFEKLASGVSAKRPVTRAALYGGGLVLFAVALAQPQCGGDAKLIKRRGVDVVVALDASKSMLARDVLPDRLERAKWELGTLLDQLKGDRIALVVFSGSAFIQCPLTSDYSAAKLFLKAVDPQQMPPGATNIGEALRLSKQVLDSADRGSKERAIVLLSDGEDLAGEVKPAVASLQEAGVKLYAIGIGSESGEPIPLLGKKGEVTGYQKDARGEVVLSRLDKNGLAQLAEATGGEFYYQPRGVAMGGVLSQIEKMQKADLESRLAFRFDEKFQYFAFAGLVLLVWAIALPEGRRRGGAKGGTAVVPLAFVLAFLWRPAALAAGLFERNHPDVEEGMKAYGAGKAGDALSSFDAAKKAVPHHPTVDFNRGDALFKQGRYAEAKDVFADVAQRAEGELKEKALYNLGNAWAKLGRTQEAASAFRKALSANPNDDDARHNLEALLSQPKPKESPDSSQDGDKDKEKKGDSPEGKKENEKEKPKDKEGPGEQEKRPGEKNPSPQQAQPESGPNPPDSEPKEGKVGENAEKPTGEGAAVSRKEAEQLLDSMKQGEKNLQLWRFQQKRRPPADVKDW